MKSITVNNLEGTGKISGPESKSSEGCSVFSNCVVSLGFNSSVNRNRAFGVALFEIRVCLDLEAAPHSFTSRRESSLPNICN